MASSAEAVFDYHCYPDWVTSSQKTYTLYKAGARLWRPEDLIDIEQQLEHIATAESFTLRRVDGSLVSVKNPMFRVQNPIWSVLNVPASLEGSKHIG